jgi:hyperosmotically inducible periplasmic protein
MLKRLAAVAFVISLVPMTALAQQAGRADLRILKDVAKQVNRYTQYSVFDDINASLDQGTVTLTGKVTMPFKSDDIEKRVARVEGVARVKNEIQVLPVSQFDNDLRYRIARAIYGNSSFWQYAAMVNPPIHIVVERGQVTLTGVVNSEVERMLARSLAAQFGAFSVTNDLKTDAEAKEALERIG